MGGFKIPDFLNKTALEILFYIDEHPGIIQSKLNDPINASGNTIALALKDLYYNGLVREERGKYNRKHLYVTEKGKEIVKKIKEIRESLGE